MEPKKQSIENLQEIINTIIDHLPVGVFVKDENLDYLYWNKFMEDVTGIDTIDIEGKNDSAVSYDALISAEKRLELEKRIIHTGESVEFHGAVKTPSGKLMHIEMSKYPFSLKDGKPLLLVLWRDVTAKLAMENELKRAHILTDIALKSADIRTSSVYVNPDSTCNFEDSTLELFHDAGTSPEHKLIPWRILLKRIHPEDVRLHIHHYIRLCKGEISECKQEYRERTQGSDDTWRWREVSAYVYERDERGRPVSLLCCSQDIEERKAQEQSLSDAKEKAEHADLLKSKYLANMSHEIRTPLNAITGFSELMMYAESDEERKEYYEIIKSNNILLMQLIGDILDLSKIEANVMKIVYAPTDLNELMTNIYASAKLRMPAGVDLVLEIGEAECTFITDTNRLQQLVSNLLNNAMKNTSGGSITFGYVREGESMKFYVRDTGIGIARDKLDTIFSRYVKVNDYVEGIGLGLAICRGLVTSMGGTISVESEPGLGSTFMFNLPVIYDI